MSLDIIIIGIFASAGILSILRFVKKTMDRAQEKARYSRDDELLRQQRTTKKGVSKKAVLTQIPEGSLFYMTNEGKQLLNKVVSEERCRAMDLAYEIRNNITLPK